MTIHTIGHSNHTWEAFAALLKQHGTEILVDARSNPVSRWAPFANKRTLPALLETADIAYVYMGDSLEGKPADEDRHDSRGKADYRKMRSDPGFQEAIADLLRLAEGASVALVCAEENPSKCHRRLLIEPELVKHGVEPLHIRRDGSVQTSGSLASHNV